MARLHFRIGDVFPHEDVVSEFLTGLCMVVNDVTLTMRHMDRTYETPGGQSGVNTYYLYLTCAYYREAAKFLAKRLKDAAVASFLEDLPPNGRAQLETVKESFTPWDASFVRDVLIPVRNVVFHYTPRSPSEMQSCLERVSDGKSHIELGEGTYLDTRYAFADAVLATYVAKKWGDSVSELTYVMERIGELVLALTYFAHEAVTLRLDQVDPGVFEVTEQNGCLGSIRAWVTRAMTRCKRLMSSR